LEEGGEGFDFLGFHHRWVRSRGVRGKQNRMHGSTWRELEEK
jgi:RNA-directed DNA polymerase